MRFIAVYILYKNPLKPRRPRLTKFNWADKVPLSPKLYRTINADTISEACSIAQKYCRKYYRLSSFTSQVLQQID